MNKKLLSILVGLAICLSLLPAVSLAGNGATLKVGKSETYEYVSQALADAKDGDTIALTGGNVWLQPGADQSSGAPYVIRKAVTIQSGENSTLIANTTGIVLDADVTIQNLNLSYIGYAEINGIFANGHALTISNMGDGNHNDHPIRVFIEIDDSIITYMLDFFFVKHCTQYFHIRISKIIYIIRFF